MLLFCFIAIASVLLPSGYGRSSGPPISNTMQRNRVCDQMLPNHPPSNPQNGNGGYFIVSDLIDNGGAYVAGQSYSIQLLGTAVDRTRSGTLGNTFRGFLIQAREGGNYIGSFINLPSLTQTLACDASNPSATVTHMNPSTVSFNSLNFTWQAPSGSDGVVSIMYTAVQEYSTYYVALNAAQERPPSTTPTVPSTTSTAPSTTMPPATLNFIRPDPPNVSPENYRLISTIPAGCTPTVDCTYFVGIQTNTNSSFLDIYLEGESEGWVAVGFSPTANMLSADVLGCNRMGQTGEVLVVDTWNPDNLPRTNVLDANQEGVFSHSAEFFNGKLSCNFSRFIGEVNPNQDLNLNGDYFLLFGQGATGGGLGRFPNHLRPNPTISASQVNPSTLTQDLNPTAPPGTFVQPDPPNVSPENYRLISRIPAGCTPTVDCSYFVGIQTNANSSFLDIYLEGESEGWVAVGFSPTANMLSADVLGCNRMGQTGEVLVVDTWNPDNLPRTNVLDANQEGVFSHSAEFVNGRISCNFSRFIGVVNPNQDLNLNGDYFLLFGRGATGGGLGNFPNHLLPNPTISAFQVNPSTLTQDLNPTAPPGTFVQPDPPNVSPENYRLISRIPAGCTPTVDCSYFVGIQTNANSSFLDIYLEGESEGWVAVGFSPTANMLSADVLGCNRMGQTGEVLVVDTWNPDNLPRTNVLDANQEGVFSHSAELVNGRISCNFSRFIGEVNPNQDLNLNGDYFLLFGQGATGGGMGNFPNHLLPNPTVSASQMNPMTAEAEVGVDTVRAGLIRAHGILMIVAWPILAVTAIFFASWMKPALPNGEWFQVHRAFLLASMFIAALGFLLIFVAFRENSLPGLITLGSSNGVGTAHFAIGIIVMALHILNPIIAAFRCKPGGKDRWIFNLFHASLIGLVVQSLALTNTGLGLSRFSTVYSRFGDLTIFWVFLAFIVVFLVLVGVFLIVFVILPCFTVHKDGSAKGAPSFVKLFVSSPRGKTYEVELTSKQNPSRNDDPPPPKTPSEDAIFRWIGLVVFLAVMLPLMVAVIVLVALPQ